MLGIAFELGGAAEVAFGEHAARVASEGEGGREEERLARDHLFRLFHIGDDALDGLARTRREPRERHRRRGELEKATPRKAGRLAFRRLSRKLPGEEGRERLVERELFEALPEAWTARRREFFTGSVEI